MPNRKHIKIAVISPSDKIKDTIYTTLSHNYPKLELEKTNNVEDVNRLSYDIVIVDTKYALGSKLDLILDKLPDIPVLIIVDGMSDVHNLSHLIQGRRELITMQGLEGLTLIQSIHHLLDRQRLHNQLKKTAQHLKELSIRDDMTRLYNHRYFNEILTSEVKKSNRYKRPLGLVMIAIKNFTAINETYGHHEGDRLLARAAGTINATVRDVDITARYGDNEFAVILPETDEEASFKASIRLFEALSGITIANGESEKKIEVSVGVSALNNTTKTKEDLLKGALRALIEAKRCVKHPIKSAGESSKEEKKIEENRQLIEHLGKLLESLSQQAHRQYFQEVLKTLSKIPAHRKYMTKHAERVAFFSERLASRLALEEDEIRIIRRASLLHDIGKLAIDTEILSKPSSLSTTETELIKKHPVLALQIIGKSQLLSEEPEIILHHHERYDGAGYPDGLVGSKIPIGARIVAITEAWDTMITGQPYRKDPLSLDAAIKELKTGAGRQFDPELVDTFTSLITG